MRRHDTLPLGYLAVTILLVLLFFLDVISDSVFLVAFLVKQLGLVAVLVGSAVWSFVIRVKNTSPAAPITEQALMDKITGVFAFIGFATVFIVSMNLLERVLGSQWQAFLTVAAVGFTAYRVLQLLFVRQRRELATGLPDPTARGARIAGAPRDRRLWH